MGKRSFLQRLFGVAMLFLAWPATAAVLYTETMESSNSITHLNLRRGAEYLNIVSGCGMDGSKCEQVQYFPNDRGSPEVTGEAMLSKPVKSAILSYQVKFDKNFEFVKGGKIHGLGSAKSAFGCTDVQPDAWSVQVMWRQNGAPELYVYGQDRLNHCGTSYSAKNFRFNPNTWYTVALTVVVNDQGKANGYAGLSVDGQKVVEINNLELCNQCNTSTQISKFMHHTYFGGSTLDWAPSKPVYGYFDNYLVVEGAVTSYPAPAPVVKPALALAPTANQGNDQRCSAVGNTIDQAQARYTEICTPLPRKDCNNIQVAGQTLWMCSSADFNSGNPIPISTNGVLTLQAEDYARNKDNTAENSGGAYRKGSADIQASADAGGGYTVGRMDDGEWLEFDLVLDSEANYTAQLRTASVLGNPAYSIWVDGQLRAANQSVQDTGDWQTYRTLPSSLGMLSKGYHRIRIVVENGSFNLNWIRLERVPALSVVVAAATKPSPAPASPTASLSCAAIGVFQWGETFLVNTVTVRNNGTKPVSDWKITLKFEKPVTIQASWNSTTEQKTGTTFSFRNVSYNRTLDPGESATFGLKGFSVGPVGKVICQ